MASLLALSIKEMEELNLIRSCEIMGIIKETLKRLDPRLIDHGDRVAFIVHEVLMQRGGCTEEQIQNICVMAFFHDIGAYKTDEIDHMVSFEIKNVWQHSVYGALFLKHFTPMGEQADAILYHHLKYSDRKQFLSPYLHEAMLLHICDRVDILQQLDVFSEDYFLQCSGTEFAPWSVDLLLQAERERHITERLKNGEYIPVMESMALSVCSCFEKALSYLKMLVYIIDFKSSVTVTHTINTIAFSVLLSRLMGMDKVEQSKIYLGALLHDLGKISTPYEILESTGKLSFAEMEIMKKHVSVTYDILHGNLSEEICRIAARHHEKLNGNGYPWGLHEADLTTAERLVAVADVMSALAGRRSYKGSFSQERSVGIILQMAEDGLLDAEICRIVVEHYAEIISAAEDNCHGTIEIYEQLMEEYSQLLQEVLQ
ncbi:MAG: HD domain-containing protein [Angelakisella sp.]